MSNKETHPLKDIIESTNTQNIMLINLICKQYEWDPNELKVLLGKKLNKESNKIYKQVAEETLNEYMNNTTIDIVSTKRFVKDGKETIKTKTKTYKPIILNGLLYLHNPKTGDNKPI